MAAPAAPAPTRAAYLQSVVRLLQTPSVVTDAELCALPHPADLPDPLDVKVLQCKGRTLFSRLYHRREDIVFRFILDADQAATHEIADALDFVLRCSEPHPARDQFLATAPGDHSRLQQCCDLRVVFQSSGPCMGALHDAMNYIHAPGATSLPTDDVLVAWGIIAFDQREPAREELLRRRAIQLTRMHVQQLLQAPPGVGRPNAADVKLYFDYHAIAGTEEEMATLFVFDAARSRERLVNELRARFPGWEPRQRVEDEDDDDHMVEAYDEQKLAAMHPGWAGEDFERHARGYLIHTLGAKEDRRKALAQLVEAHGARVTPLLVFDVLDLDRVDDDDPSHVQQQFSVFIRTIWNPRVQPSRDAIVQCAATLYRARGNAIRAVFLFAAVPYLVNWPCEADTAFIGALLADIPSDRERVETLSCFLEDNVPEGAQHMSYQDIHQFLDPLFQQLPDNHGRGSAVVRYVQTWSIPISDSVRDHLARRTTLRPAMQQFIERAIDEQRIRAKSSLSRKRARDARYANHIQDAVAPEDAPDDATCVACRSNLRRVCFVPCGHIVACIRCAAQCNNKCPMCRAAVVHAPPCIVPITSSPPTPSPTATPASAPAAASD